MEKVDKDDCCAGGSGLSCCKVEAMVSVDERGQMVLPKELRDRAGIRAGDKLAVVSWERGGRIGLLTLIKAGDFTEMVRELLGPMAKDLMSDKK
ncbi:MAG: HgcAB-associated protein [Chloroflexota bacterium]